MQSQALQVPHDGPTFCPESSFVFLHFIRQQGAILFFKFRSISSVTFLVLGLQKFSLKCITRLKTLLLFFLTSTPSPLSHPSIVSSSSYLSSVSSFLIFWHPFESLKPRRSFTVPFVRPFWLRRTLMPSWETLYVHIIGTPSFSIYP